MANASGHHAAYELRLATYEKLQQLSFSFHDRVHSGDLITLGILDIDGVRMFFSTGLVRMVLLTVLIGVGAYLLISTDLLLGLLSLSFVPFVGWRSSVVQLKLRATWLELQDRLTVHVAGDGRKPRRHPRGAGLRGAGARARQVRRGVAERAGAGA